MPLRNREIAEQTIYGQPRRIGVPKAPPSTINSTALTYQESYADRYLSVSHRDNPSDGCTMAALAQEIARATPELKTAFEHGLEEILSATGGDRKEAIFEAAATIGGIVLARAVQDRRLSDEILRSVRQELG